MLNKKRKIMKHLDLKKFHEILFVFDSKKKEQIVATLFKRSIPFVATYTNNFREACNKLSQQQYDIVVFGDFVDGHGFREYAYMKLIPEINKQQDSSVIMMIYDDKAVASHASEAGVDIIFPLEKVELSNKFNEVFELVPIQKKFCR